MKKIIVTGLICATIVLLLAAGCCPCMKGDKGDKGSEQKMSETSETK